jgi:hypothetical protein
MASKVEASAIREGLFGLVFLSNGLCWLFKGCFIYADMMRRIIY